MMHVSAVELEACAGPYDTTVLPLPTKVLFVFNESNFTMVLILILIG
jgi:hypothetical protein